MRSEATWQSVPLPPQGYFAPRRECLSFVVKRKTPKKTTQTYGLRTPLRGAIVPSLLLFPSRPRRFPGFSRSKGLCPVLFPLPLRCRCPVPRSGLVVLPFRAVFRRALQTGRQSRRPLRRKTDCHVGLRPPRNDIPVLRSSRLFRQDEARHSLKPPDFSFCR